MQESKKKAYLFLCIAAVLIIAFDQITKLLIVNTYAVGEGTPLISGVFELLHIHNSGSAWGMLSGKTWLLTIISIVLSAALIYVYHNIAAGKYYFWLRLCIAFIFGGAIGNMIDRIRLGYVVDFLYFKLIDFPVFNVADIFVTVPVILLILLVIFRYHGEDFDVILGDKIRLEDGTYQEKKGKAKKIDTEK